MRPFFCSVVTVSVSVFPSAEKIASLFFTFQTGEQFFFKFEYRAVARRRRVVAVSSRSGRVRRFGLKGRLRLAWRRRVEPSAAWLIIADFKIHVRTAAGLRGGLLETRMRRERLRRRGDMLRRRRRIRRAGSARLCTSRWLKCGRWRGRGRHLNRERGFFVSSLTALRRISPSRRRWRRRRGRRRRRRRRPH